MAGPPFHGSCPAILHFESLATQNLLPYLVMKRVLGGVLGVVALGCLLWTGEVAIDAVFNPWAHSGLGVSTLTGTWVGGYSDLDGRQRTAFLELRRNMTPGGRYEDEDSRITGELHVCGSSGASYTISGDPHGWRGTAFSIRRMNIQSPAKPLGYYFHHAEGTWAGDRITLSVKPAYFDTDGGMFASGPRFPGLRKTMQLELLRGTRATFEQTCSATRKGAR